MHTEFQGKLSSGHIENQLLYLHWHKCSSTSLHIGRTKMTCCFWEFLSVSHFPFMENYLWWSSGNELWPWQWGQHAQLRHRPALSCCLPRALPRRLWAWLRVTLLVGTWPGGDTRAKRGKSSKNLAYKHSCPLGDVNHPLHHNISIIPFSALFFSLHSSNFNILLLLPHEK